MTRLEITLYIDWAKGAEVARTTAVGELADCAAKAIANDRRVARARVNVIVSQELDG